MHQEAAEDVLSGANEQFIARMKETREQKGWSQRRLADELEARGVKLDPSAVTRIENGHREPKLREAVAIARCLGVSLQGLSTRPTTAGRDAIMECFFWLDRLESLITEGSSIAERIRELGIGPSAFDIPLPLSDPTPPTRNGISGLDELIAALPLILSQMRSRGPLMDLRMVIHRASDT